MNFMLVNLVIPIIFGLVAGWFVNYLADVLPYTRRFSQPICRLCGAPFGLWGYLLFRPCKNGHSRNLRLWSIQIIILIASIYTWQQPPSKIGYFAGLILVIYFGVVFVIDMEHRLILHPTSVFGAVFGIVIGIIAHGTGPTLWDRISSTLLGGLGGFLIMMGFYYLGVLFAHIRARRMRAQGQETDDEEALGSGDVILVTVLGFILGWPLIWLCLLYGILLGGLVSFFIILWLVASRRYGTSALMTFIPYGPYFIVTAAMIVYFPQIVRMIVPD